VRGFARTRAEVNPSGSVPGGDANPGITPSPGKVVTFRFFIPRAAPVTAAQPYVADNFWQWSASWYTVSNATKGSWQTFTVPVSPGGGRSPEPRRTRSSAELATPPG
jgi:hypothetical protein